MGAFDNYSDDDLQALIANMISEFGRRKFEAGRKAMRDSILRAADAPSLAPVATVTADEAAPTTRRAARGSVGHAVDSILRASPGISITEMEQRATALNPEISIKSVGNELRRFEGKKYRRDRPGGYQWFLIEDQDGGETGDGAPAADLLSNEGGSDDAAP